MQPNLLNYDLFIFYFTNQKCNTILQKTKCKFVFVPIELHELTVSNMMIHYLIIL